MKNTGLVFAIISVAITLLIFSMPDLFSFNDLTALTIPGVIIVSLIGTVLNIIAYFQISQGQPKSKTIIAMILCGLNVLFIIFYLFI
ncbi:MAG: hypothetical protein WBP45_09165 [Daejeonella sp.]